MCLESVSKPFERQKGAGSHFVPLPRLVLPTLSPLFGGCKTAIRKTFIPAQLVFIIEFSRQRAPQLQEHILFLPISQASPTR
jgi:hypothetical protein